MTPELTDWRLSTTHTPLLGSQMSDLRNGSPSSRALGENARVPAYTVNEDAVRHAKQLIDARQYVLRLALAERATAGTGSRTRS